MDKFLLHLVCHFIHPFSYLFPRRKQRWAFGSFRGAFNDNAKYLFIHCSSHCEGVECVWLSNNKETVRFVRSKGLNAHYIASPKGAWLALTAKYWFVNSYTADILYAFSGGAIVINLWHGVGLKRIEFNITSGPLATRYQEWHFRERFFHPEVFHRPDYVLTSTPFQTAMFAPAFRISPFRCLELGYPRNTILTYSNKERDHFIDRYEPTETKELLQYIKDNHFSKVFIYMPTWRDSQRNIFAQHFDMLQMDALLQKHNALLLLKPHANVCTNSHEFAPLRHICFIDGKVDVYPILPRTDVLITDYSSILYDYILMPDKNVILYLYDYDDYVNSRGLFYPFDENVVGRKVFSFDELLSCMDAGDYTISPTQRQHILHKFWGENATQCNPNISIVSCVRNGNLTKL